MDLIFIIQTVCVVLTLTEYVAQIWKTYRTKHTRDLSIGYWVCKNSINVLQIVILILSDNPLKVFLSQCIGLFGCIIIFIMILHYNKKAREEDD